MTEQQTLSCEQCGAARAHRYQLVSLTMIDDPASEQRFHLCVRCARTRRRERDGEAGGAGLTRAEVIAELERFFAESGALEICRRCHAQGTGCCPPSCRALGASGCTKKNLFCAAFTCSALLNAITECDRPIGRRLKWITRELGSVEFRVYEMMTRVPAARREPVRPLALLARYPAPLGLGDGHALRAKLSALAEEVLAVRRSWSAQERLGTE